MNMHTGTHTQPSEIRSRSRQGLSLAGMIPPQIPNACCQSGGDRTYEIHSPVKKDVSVVECNKVGTCFEPFYHVFPRPPRVTLKRALQCWPLPFCWLCAPLVTKHRPPTLKGAFNITACAAKNFGLACRFKRHYISSAVPISKRTQTLFTG